VATNTKNTRRAKISSKNTRSLETSTKNIQRKQYNDHDDRKGYYDNRDYDDRDRSYYSGGKFFSDRHRTALRGYYDNYTRSGRCPPGLAKKNNGCIPPGQAKKWAIGQPLPGDMAYSDLSSDLARILGLPPQGYRYVQSGSDILMINGARIVMDAINNWGRYTLRGHGCGFFEHLKFWVQKRFYLFTKLCFHLCKATINSRFELGKRFIKFIV